MKISSHRKNDILVVSNTRSNAFLVYISLSDSSLSTGLCFYKIEWIFFIKSGVSGIMSLWLDERNLKNSQNRDFCVGFGCLLNLVFKCLNIPTYYSYQLFTFSKRNSSAGTSSDLKYFHYNRKLSTFFSGNIHFFKTNCFLEKRVLLLLVRKCPHILRIKMEQYPHFKKYILIIGNNPHFRMKYPLFLKRTVFLELFIWTPDGKKL